MNNKKTVGRPSILSNRDWTALGLEYEAGGDDLTLEALAAKHAISYGTLKNHSAEKGWSARREAFREDALKKARRVLQQKLSKAMIDETEQDFNVLRRAEVELVEQIQTGELEANSLDAAVRALIEIIKAKRLIVGEATGRDELSGPDGGAIPLAWWTTIEQAQAEDNGDSDGDSGGPDTD